MSFATDKFIPSGTYLIINVKFDLSIACRAVTSRADPDFEWDITLLASKKWIIESRSNSFSATMPPEPEENDEINRKKGNDQPHHWVIKRRQGTTDTYIIYSPTKPGLFWSLRDADEGKVPRLASDQTDNSCWWRLSRVKDPRDLDGSDGPDNHNPNPLQVTRPTQHIPAVGHRVMITVPPEWLTTISAISFGQCLNLVRVRRQVKGVLESQEFISPWELIDQPMVLDVNNATSCAMQAVDEATVIVLEFFHSRNPRRRDPHGLPGKGDVSTSLRISSASRPTDMRSFPDYQTFSIFDEQAPGGPISGTGFNAIVMVQCSTKVFIDLEDPGVPPPGTVQDGYDQNLDRPRPRHLDEYLENYKVIFIIDDSGSMSGGRWKQVLAAFTEIGNEAMQYDADGIEICFINSPVRREFVKNQDEILTTYSQVWPGGGTPTGAKLQTVLTEIIDKLEAAVDTAAYGLIKPMDIIVITDGVPTDDPAPVIQTAARQLDEGLHHPNAVGIQFVQIGNDEGADTALQALCNGPVRSMVDTVPYVTTFTPERLRRVILGAMHPSIRARISN